jgi:hypothetical protein
VPSHRRGADCSYLANHTVEDGENVPFLALDLLAGIVAVRVDARPPFSALFTLWLSMIAAVG